MKYIKDRAKFLLESKEIMKDNALDILSDNDDAQSPELQEVLDKLDAIPNESNVRTRFAPSPTGKLHIGGSRTALYNYLFAKKHGGVFYVRVEDTDQKRFDPQAEDYIKKSLDWCGITPDESPWHGGSYGPYRQSERDYTKHIKTLLDGGFAYYAFDTETDLTEARKNEPNFAYNAKTRMQMKNSLSLSKEEVTKLLNDNHQYVIRFKVPENKSISFDDIIRGTVTFNSNQIDDKVIVKSNGIPTYHGASVMDDHDMKTSHVIRGEEWLSSAPFHILLYEAFGWTPPKFAHLPLLLNPDGPGKLSKRKALKLGVPVFTHGGIGADDDGKEVFFKGFEDEGYDSDSLVNFLALLGWSPGDNKEILSMADMISTFDLKNVNKSGAKFDIDKAKWFNQQYLNTRSDDELLKHIDKGDTFKYDNDKLSKIVDLCRKRSVFSKDLQSVADIFFKPIVLADDDKKKITDDFKIVFGEFVNRSVDINWSSETVKQLIHDISVEKAVKMGKIMPSLRLVLANGLPGPDLMTIMDIIGKDESLNRIKNGL